MNISNSLYFLNNHPAFAENFQRCLYFFTIDFHRNLKTQKLECIDYNTKKCKIDLTYFCFELGPCRYFPKEKRMEYWDDYTLFTRSKSFEKGIISLAQKVKKIYGNFSTESIEPQWIKEYNKGKEPFFTEPCSKKGYTQLITNKDYVFLMPHHYNEIWWQCWAKENLKSMYEERSDVIPLNVYFNKNEFLRIRKNAKIFYANYVQRNSCCFCKKILC